VNNDRSATAALGFHVIVIAGGGFPWLALDRADHKIGVMENFIGENREPLCRMIVRPFCVGALANDRIA
jgi:hypothetical protein